MKPSSGFGSAAGTYLDIKVQASAPVEAVEEQPEAPPVRVNGPLLNAVSGYAVNSAISFHQPTQVRFKLPHIDVSRKMLVITMVATCLIATAAIIAGPLRGNVQRLYSDIYNKIALELTPLPPLTKGDIRVASTKVGQLEDSINTQALSLKLGTTTINPTAKLISSWYKTSASKYGQTTLYLNKSAISSYLTQTVSKLKVAPVNQVTVSLNDGYTTTLSGGSNGISFASVGGLSNQIDQKLLSGKGMNLSLPSVVVPHGVSNQATIPELLEVDVTTKRMYAYQNGQLIRTFLVTAGAPDTPTPLGNFKIWEKLPVQTMTGYNPNGTMYVQPNVQWVNYFDHSGDAVHGNYWRPLSYFGNVNSSHGCVGVVDSDAQWIYNWAPIGTPVVIHS